MTIALPILRSSERRDAKALRELILPLLIGAAPCIFALSTWNPALDSNNLSTARSFGFPVIAIEALLLFWAMRCGFSVTTALRPFESWQRWVLGCLCLIAFFTAFAVAPDRATALARTCITVLHLIFALAAAHLLRCSTSPRRHLWPAVALGMCGYIVLFPFYLAAIPDQSAFDWVHLGLGVINVRQVGFYMATGSAAALGLAFFAERKITTLAWTLVATVGFALSAWTGTRGSIAAVPAAVVIAALFVPAIPRVRALTTTTASVAIGALVSLTLSVPDPAYGLWRISSSLAGDNVATGRLGMWIGTIRGIAGRPWFGHGESQFRLLVPEAVGVYNHPHNLILQLAFQWGVIGLLCVMALGLAAAPRAVAAARRAPKEAAPALLVLFCLLIFSMYEGAGYHPYPVMMIALSFSFLLTIPRADQRVGRDAPIG